MCVCFFLCICLYLFSPQWKALLINHAVFRLELQKEKQVNARVTNAVERAGKNITLFFPSILIHSISVCSHFSTNICNPCFFFQSFCQQQMATQFGNYGSVFSGVSGARHINLISTYGTYIDLLSVCRYNLDMKRCDVYRLCLVFSFAVPVLKFKS